MKCGKIISPTISSIEDISENDVIDFLEQNVI